MTSRDDIETLIAGAKRIANTRERQSAAESMADELLGAASDEYGLKTATRVGGRGARGTIVEDMEAVDPFGQDQSPYYEYKPGDTQYESQELAKLKEMLGDMEDTDDLGRRQYEGGQVRLKTGESPEDYDELREAIQQGSEGAERPRVAPKSVMADALRQLEASAQGDQGIRGRIASVFGGAPSLPEGFIATQGSLQDQLRGPSAQIAADKGAAQDEFLRDKGLYSRQAREYNDVKAQIEAEGLLRESMTGRPAMMDTPQMKAAMEDAEFVRFHDVLNAADKGTEVGTYVDPTTGRPLSVQSPVSNAIAGSNTPTTSQQLNAPTADSAVDFVVRQVNPEAGSDAASRRFGQQNITAVTTDFSDRVRKLGAQKAYQNSGLAGVSPNIRTIDEFAATVGAIRGVMGEDKSVQEIMQKIKMGPAQQQRFGETMFQLTAAQEGGRQPAYFNRSSNLVTLNPNNREDAQRIRGLGTPYVTAGGNPVYMDSAEALPSAGLSETGTKVERLRSGQRRTGSTRDIVDELKELDDPSAQTPFIGQVAGEKPRVNRRKPAGMGSGEELESNLRRQAISRQRPGETMDRERLRSNITKARLAEEREARDAKKRRAQGAEQAQYTMADPRNIRRAFNR